jgi:hypothetical protein
MRPLNSLVGLGSPPAATFNHLFRRTSMKHLRQLCAVAVLTFALTLSAFAGDIHTGDIPPPPPIDPSKSIMGDMATGITAVDGRSSTEATFADPVTDFTLNILQSVLSLF